MIGATATVLTPTLDAWRGKLRGGVAQRIATRSARRQQARMQETAPVDTGAMSISGVVATPQGSDYGERASSVRELNPAAPLFPPVGAPAADSATVVSIVEYGAAVNSGTIHQRAQPWWDTARLETETALGADAAAEWGA